MTTLVSNSVHIYSVIRIIYQQTRFKYRIQQQLIIAPRQYDFSFFRSGHSSKFNTFMY